jgi:hypothetical protein
MQSGQAGSVKLCQVAILAILLCVSISSCANVQNAHNVLHWDWAGKDSLHVIQSLFEGCVSINNNGGAITISDHSGDQNLLHDSLFIGCRTTGTSAGGAVMINVRPGKIDSCCAAQCQSGNGGSFFLRTGSHYVLRTLVGFVDWQGDTTGCGFMWGESPTSSTLLDVNLTDCHVTTSGSALHYADGSTGSCSSAILHHQTGDCALCLRQMELCSTIRVL